MSSSPASSRLSRRGPRPSSTPGACRTARRSPTGPSTTSSPSGSEPTRSSTTTTATTCSVRTSRSPRAGASRPWPSPPTTGMVPDAYTELLSQVKQGNFTAFDLLDQAATQLSSDDNPTTGDCLYTPLGPSIGGCITGGTDVVNQAAQAGVQPVPVVRTHTALAHEPPGVLARLPEPHPLAGAAGGARRVRLLTAAGGVSDSNRRHRPEPGGPSPGVCLELGLAGDIGDGDRRAGRSDGGDGVGRLRRLRGG